MSKRELERAGVLARVKSGELLLTDAAKLMSMSYRNAKRLRKRYVAGGAAALKHGNAGRRSNRARPAKERAKIVKLVRQKYSGDTQTRFGPTLAAEHLASEDRLKVHPETLRRWMLAEGLWSKVRKRREHRKRRERRAPFGGIVLFCCQFIACFYDPGSTLVLLIIMCVSTVTVYDSTGECAAH